MSSNEELIASILGVSNTSANQTFYILRDMTNRYLESMIAHRVRDLPRANQAYQTYINQIRELTVSIERDSDTVANIQPPQNTGVSVMGGIRNIVQFDIETAKLELAEASKWLRVVEENLQRTWALIFQHTRLTHTQYLHYTPDDFSLLVQSGYFEQCGYDICSDYDNSTYCRLAIDLLTMQRSYFEWMLEDFSHEENQKNYFTIKLCDFLKGELEGGDPDKKIEAGKDRKILQETVDEYYNGSM